MVHNEKYNFVFVRNPKCATSYIGKYLRQHDGHGNLKKIHHNFRSGRPLIPWLTEDAKVFGTIRNPFDFYTSLWSFSQKTHNHTHYFFNYGSFDTFFNQVVDMKPKSLPSLMRFTGYSLPPRFNYGYATFSALNWLTKKANFKKPEENTFIKIFRTEDDFRPQIDDYLGLDEYEWPEQRENVTKHVIQLTRKQKQRVLERDRFVFENWYPEYLK